MQNFLGGQRGKYIYYHHHHHHSPQTAWLITQPSIHSFIRSRARRKKQNRPSPNSNKFKSCKRGPTTSETYNKLQKKK